MQTKLTPLLSIAGLLALWVVASTLKADPQVLPTPWALAPLFAQEIASGELWTHLSATLLRVLWAFCLAMTLGGIIGLAMGRSPALNRWLDPWLVIFLNLPALVLIVLCYLWIGLTEAAAYQIAAGHGYDAVALKAVADSEEISDKLNTNYQLAQVLGLQGTPAFIIGDQVIRGFLPMQDMLAVIEEVRAASN